MKIAMILFVLGGAIAGGAGDSAAATFLAAPPAKPHSRDFHTRLLASFDSPGSADADFARGVAHGQGNHVQFGAPGKFGSSLGLINLVHAYGHLPGDWRYVKPTGWYFAGGENLPGRTLTIEFWVRSRPERNIWSDDDEHYLLNLVGERSPLAPGDGFDAALLKTAGSKELELRLGEAARLSLPVQDLAPESWHHVAVSWDFLASPGRMWLAVDGRGVAEAAPPELRPRPFVCLQLGNTLDFEANQPLDGFIDDLLVSDQSLGERLAAAGGAPALDEDRAMRAEDGARKFLQLMESLGRYGDWHYGYQWPTRIPMSSHLVRAPSQPQWPSMKYGRPARMGSLFLEMYEATGDERWLLAAHTSGEFLLRGQQPGGYWATSYGATPGGPIGESDYARIQDGFQTVPMVFLVYLHRITGDARYLHAAVRTADFLAAAQNPNGSWSGGYQWAERRGLTAEKNLPNGGEFNDGATRDPIAGLLFMFQVTKDRKHLAPIVKAADWVISAEIKGQARGWAQQYDEHGRPAWARRHEPPAVCAREFPQSVAGIMFWAYLLTGDKKYPDSLRGTLKWMRSVERPEGWSFYYDPETGKPVYSVDYKMLELHDDPKLNDPAPIGFYGYARYDLDWIERALDLVDSGQYAAPRLSLAVTPEEVAQRRKSLAAAIRSSSRVQQVEGALASQRPDGGWLDEAPTWGSILKEADGALLVRFVLDARAAAGKVPHQWLCTGSPSPFETGRAWFEENWFDAPPLGK